VKRLLGSFDFFCELITRIIDNIFSLLLALLFGITDDSCRLFSCSRNDILRL